ncbi:MAG TPA: DUF433 domain-containing protein [Spirochaetia bacterium]|nr:DUF433 domain-containing protein [Spirochaetia bacterium]
MEYRDRISVSPDAMLGKPVIKGTRITVELILRKLSEGADTDDVLEGYPDLRREDILPALSYCAEVISSED